eukprot:352308-Chlamydomonas_euryale.AAC.1
MTLRIVTGTAGTAGRECSSAGGECSSAGRECSSGQVSSFWGLVAAGRQSTGHMRRILQQRLQTERHSSASGYQCAAFEACELGDKITL